MKKMSFIKGKLFSILFVPLVSVFYSPLMLIFGENDVNKDANQTMSNPPMNSKGTLLWRATAETGDLSEWTKNGGNYMMNADKVLFSNASREKAKSGSQSFKLRVDAGDGMASTQLFRHGEKAEPNSNKDAIYTAWYFIPQKIDFSKGASWHNMMQWKVRTTADKSHPVLTLGLGVIGGDGSGGDNFIQLRNTAEWFPNGSSFDYKPLKNLKVPIGKWFKIEARYIHGANKNGRILVWQGDLEGNDTLIYDISGVTTYPSVDRDKNATTSLNWSVNNYTSRTIPSITTIFIDDVSIHLPGTEPSSEKSYSINARPHPKEGGSVKVTVNK